MVIPGGLEPPTYGLGNRRSVQLSYGTAKIGLAQVNRDYSRFSAFALFVLLFFHGLHPATAAPCPPAEAVQAVGRRALDERTILLTDGREVRLAGIAAAAPFKAQAKSALDEMVAGKNLTLRTIPPKIDRWGRMVAHVDGVEEDLVARGLAHAAMAERTACIDALLSREAAARREHLGVWRDPGYVMKAQDLTALAGRVGEHVIASGRVESARVAGVRLYLNFARRWRSGLSVSISTKDAAGFGLAGTAAQTLIGSYIRVRGVLEWRNGPVIAAMPGEPIERMDKTDVTGQQGQ